MRIDLVERAVAGVSLLTVGLAAVCTLFFGVVAEKASGVPEPVVLTLLETERWVREKRAVHAVPAIPPPSRDETTRPEPTTRAPERSPETRVEAGETRVPGAEWIVREAGVRYAPVTVVPELLQRKYRAVEDVMEVAATGGGEFVETPAGSGYRVTWIEERSPLRSVLALEPDDVVLSVNGHPVGKSVDAGRKLYELLRGETRFAVKLLRRGTTVVLPFVVK